MHLKNAKRTKKPSVPANSSTMRCSTCGKSNIRLTETDYSLNVRHDGRIYALTIPKFKILQCDDCDERMMTEDNDIQVSEALRKQLGLMSPKQIRAGLKQLKISQKQLSTRLGIAEETISRWLNNSQIQ